MTGQFIPRSEDWVNFITSPEGKAWQKKLFCNLRQPNALTKNGKKFKKKEADNTGK